MNKWTREWPTEPGSYWFWGYINCNLDDDGLHLCTAYTHAGNSLIKAGSIVVYCENTQVDELLTNGKWMPAQTPSKPEDSVTYG